MSTLNNSRNEAAVDGRKKRWVQTCPIIHSLSQTFLSFSPLSHPISNDYPYFKLGKRGRIQYARLSRDKGTNGKEKRKNGCNGELEGSNPLPESQPSSLLPAFVIIKDNSLAAVCSFRQRTLHLPVNVKIENLPLTVPENCRIWPSTQLWLLAKANPAKPHLSAFDGSEKLSVEPSIEQMTLTILELGRLDCGACPSSEGPLRCRVGPPTMYEVRRCLAWR